MDASFAHFDLNLSPREQTALQALKISHEDSYLNFGDIFLLKSETSRFIQSLGNTPELSDEIGATVDRLTKDSLSAFGAETGWITLRAATPTDYFDVPRWHSDGYFYTPFSGDQNKAAMPLKGASTLFCDLPPELREEFNKRLRSDRNTGDLESRKSMIELINPA